MFTDIIKNVQIRNFIKLYINPLNAELNPICHLLTLLAHPIFHISRIRVKQNRNTGSHPFLFMHTPTHRITCGTFRKQVVQSLTTEEYSCLALVTAVSCPSDSEGSPRLNWKALQSNKVQHH
jgi:hypothetical protein